jgi:hypothetical protein
MVLARLDCPEEDESRPIRRDDQRLQCRILPPDIDTKRGNCHRRHPTEGCEMVGYIRSHRL